MKKARIVRDRYCGYEVQVKRFWWSPWLQPRCNTHTTIESAEKFIKEAVFEPVLPKIYTNKDFK